MHLLQQFKICLPPLSTIVLLIAKIWWNFCNIQSNEFPLSCWFEWFLLLHIYTKFLQVEILPPLHGGKVLILVLFFGGMYYYLLHVVCQCFSFIIAVEQLVSTIFYHYWFCIVIKHYHIYLFCWSLHCSLCKPSSCTDSSALSISLNIICAFFAFAGSDGRSNSSVHDQSISTSNPLSLLLVVFSFKHPIGKK